MFPCLAERSATYQAPRATRLKSKERALAWATLAGLLLSLSGVAALGARPVWEFIRVSVSSTGEPANDRSRLPALSGDGRFVAFVSWADNLTPGADRGIYRHDLQTRQTELVSKNLSGEPTGYGGWSPALSHDGRYLAFVSRASDLVPSDTNGFSDVFVWDAQLDSLERVSVSTAGQQGNDDSDGDDYFRFRVGSVSISADGRCVAFTSWASNLVAGDTNERADVFIHDRQTASTERVSLAGSGAQADGRSGSPALSGNGRYIAFSSTATNLVPSDTNGHEDIFVRDRFAGTTERISVNTNGDGANSFSWLPAISADGRRVAFRSCADNLGPPRRTSLDQACSPDVFLRDRSAGVTIRVSGRNPRTASSGNVSRPAISADGGSVVYEGGEVDYAPIFGPVAQANAAPGPGRGPGPRPGIYVYDVSTDRATFIAYTQAPRTERRYRERRRGWFHEGVLPSVSADGGLVVFPSSRLGKAREPRDGLLSIYAAAPVLRGGRLLVKSRLNFGRVRLGSRRLETLYIFNASATEPLHGAITAPATPFSIISGGGRFVVAPNDSRAVTLAFSPTTPGRVRTELVIESSDPRRLRRVVTLRGQGR